jgi:hypothetical protein
MFQHSFYFQIRKLLLQSCMALLCQHQRNPTQVSQEPKKYIMNDCLLFSYSSWKLIIWDTKLRHKLANLDWLRSLLIGYFSAYELRFTFMMWLCIWPFIIANVCWQIIEMETVNHYITWNIVTLAFKVPFLQSHFLYILTITELCPNTAIYPTNFYREEWRQNSSKRP